jgi:tetratricopeptide (TPR) repeat protein
LARGNSEDANQRYRAALVLWRGSALAGIDSQLVRQAAAAIDEEGDRVREECLEVELALGLGGELIAELTDAVRQRPYREKLHGALMLALYRAGRQVDALGAYRHARQVLKEEVGAEPGADLQSLHRAILRRDPELDPARRAPGTMATAGTPEFRPAVPRTLPPDAPDFVGRTEEIGTVRKVMPSTSGGVSTVVVTGRAGVGKTTLSVHIAHGLRAAYPDGQLYVDLHGFHKGDPVEPFEVLGRFLRAFGVDGASLPASLDERAELYRDLLFGRRVLVVLDNAATDDQILPLIPSAEGCGVLINSRLRLGAAFGGEALNLDALPATESTRLVARIAGAERVGAEPEAASALVALCGGLPLAIRVAAGKLATKPHWSVGKLVGMLRDERRRLDHLAHGRLDVRANITLSYTGLSKDSQRLLCRLGDLSLPEVTVWVSSALLDVPLSRAEETLELLFDAQLVDVVGQDAPGQSRYRLHDLVRVFGKERAELDERPDDLEEARIRAFGAWLYVADRVYERLGGGDDYLPSHSSAPRWVLDHELVEALTADPQSWFDRERPALIAMVQRAADDGHSEVCWDLACTTSPLFRMRRQFDDWGLVLDPALMVTQGRGDLLGRAAVMCRLGTLCSNRSDFDGALRNFEQARHLFEQIGDSHGRAMATAQIGTVERFRGNQDNALGLYRQALPGLRRAKDLGGEALVLRGIGQIYLDLGNYRASEAHFARALRMYRQVGERRGEAPVLFWLGMLRLQQQHHTEAERLFDEVLGISRELDDRPGQIQALRGLGLCYHRMGHSSRARSTLMSALRLATQPRPTLLEGHVRSALAELAPLAEADESLTQ